MTFNAMLTAVCNAAESIDDEIKNKLTDELLSHEYVPYVTVDVAPSMGAVLVKYCNSVVWSSENDSFDEYESAEEFKDMLRSEICLCAKFMALAVEHLTAEAIFAS